VALATKPHSFPGLRWKPGSRKYRWMWQSLPGWKTTHPWKLPTDELFLFTTTLSLGLI